MVIVPLRRACRPLLGPCFVRAHRPGCWPSGSCPARLRRPPAAPLLSLTARTKPRLRVPASCVGGLPATPSRQRLRSSTFRVRRLCLRSLLVRRLLSRRDRRGRRAAVSSSGRARRSRLRSVLPRAQVLSSARVRRSRLRSALQQLTALPRSLPRAGS